MMWKKLLWIGMLLTVSLGMKAQEKAYFQQQVHTKIEVALNDISHTLQGNIELDYTNNSPDTLTFIYFHLYPNAYKNDYTAYARQMMQNGKNNFLKLKNEDRGFINGLAFTVNGTKSTIQNTTDIDVIKVLLPQPLVPRQTIKIATPFFVKLPIMTSRLGHVGQSYQVTQWFPKPAVYDRNGWNPFPYLNFGEFYSEFGNYDVSITLPQNYIVMATGNLQTPTEQAWLDSLASLPVTAFVSKKDTIPSSAAQKTIRFTENNIHDFAWFADKNWVVRQKNILLEEYSKEIAATACFFIDDTSGNSESLQYISNAIKGYSKFVGAYPFQTVKTVTGPLSAGGGMEYPTITIIDAFRDKSQVEQVIVHEIGHNWFYGLLGNNERIYPFMDESINSYYESRVIDFFAQPTSTSTFDRSNDIGKIVLSQLTASNKSLAITEPSTHFPEMNYGMDIYQKGTIYFEYLAKYMGVDNFDKAIQHYFQEWKYKHPQPKDFKNSLQSQTNKPIGWFFEHAINEAHLPDFQLKKDKENLIIKQNSGKELPAEIVFFDAQDNVVDSIWTPPFRGTYSLQVPKQISYSYATLGSATPDANTSNNSSEKKVVIQPFIGYTSKPVYNIYVSPSLGYNIYDKFMIGGVVHNMTLASKKLEYVFAPMYAVGSNQFVYTGLVNYFWSINNSTLKDVQFTWNSKKFSQSQSYFFEEASTQYIKNKIGASFNFTTPKETFHLTQKLSVNYYNIGHNSISYEVDNNYQPTAYTKEKYTFQHFYSATYELANNRKFYPYSLTANINGGKDFMMLSLDGRYKINYRASSRGIKLRGYAGLLNNIGATNAPTYAQLNITGSGWNDYLYDHTFIGRNASKGFWSNQSTLSMGGFYTHNKQHINQTGVTDNYLLAFNSDIAVPKTPLSLFFNIAYTGNYKNFMGMPTEQLNYEAGIAVHFTDRVTIALPLILSKDLYDYRNYILGKNKMLKSIAFRVDLNNLVPSRNITNLLFRLF